MIVFRVENAEGKGPYNAGAGDLLSQGVCESRCPGPYRDVQGWESIDYHERVAFRFGFYTLRDLRRWFTPPQIAGLEWRGFRLAAYETARVHFGSKQVAFLPVRRLRTVAFPKRWMTANAEETHA